LTSEATRLGVIEGGLKRMPSMTDQWNEHLKCPQCRNVGLVSLSQLKDAFMPTVHSVADGFKVVQTQYGPNFHCGVCDIPAMP
jgi:hypothetical protein